jgi:hypothetical protein
MKIILLLTLLISSNSFSSDWKDVPGNSWSVDISSIQKLSNGNLKVWTKNIKSPEIISNMTEKFNKIGVNKDYSRYFYSLSMFEYNCSQRTHRVTQGIDYSIDNRIISQWDLQNSDNPFSSIIPDTEGELTFKYVCRRK